MFSTLSRFCGALVLAGLAVVLMTHGAVAPTAASAHSSGWSISAAVSSDRAPCDPGRHPSHDVSATDSVRLAEDGPELVSPHTSGSRCPSALPAVVPALPTGPATVSDAASTVVRLGVLIR